MPCCASETFIYILLSLSVIFTWLTAASWYYLRWWKCVFIEGIELQATVTDIGVSRRCQLLERWRKPPCRLRLRYTYEGKEYEPEQDTFHQHQSNYESLQVIQIRILSENPEKPFLVDTILRRKNEWIGTLMINSILTLELLGLSIKYSFEIDPSLLRQTEQTMFATILGVFFLSLAIVIVLLRKRIKSTPSQLPH